MKTTSDNIRFRKGLPSPNQIEAWEEWETRGGQTERFRIINSIVHVWRRNKWRPFDAEMTVREWSLRWFRPQAGMAPQPWSVAPPDFIIRAHSIALSSPNISHRATASSFRW